MTLRIRVGSALIDGELYIPSAGAELCLQLASGCIVGGGVGSEPESDAGAYTQARPGQYSFEVQAQGSLVSYSSDHRSSSSDRFRDDADSRYLSPSAQDS